MSVAPVVLVKPYSEKVPGLMNFEGKHVLVTGGGRGIGRAVAQGFAQRGARVAIAYKSNHDAANATLASLAGDGHIKIGGEIADTDFAKQLIDRTIEGLGGLDILVNNAAIFQAHPIDETDFETWCARWRATIDTNLIAPANLCFHAAQHMMRRGGGRIVNVSSRGAFRGEPENPAYGASKAGLNALSQSLAQKLAPWNITVGAVAPSVTDTDLAAGILSGPRAEDIRNQSNLKRVANPEEVAHAVLFLASEGAEFSTGAIIDVNGASYLRS